MDQLDQLFEKYRNNTYTPEELEELYGYFAGAQDEDRLKALIEAALDQEVKIDPAIKAETDQVYAALREKMQTEEPSRRQVWSLGRWAVAASILLLASVGGYLWLHKSQPVQQAAVNDVKPYTKQAILKTGHGATLVLDSNRKGTLAQYANTNIQQTSGQVAYKNTNVADDKVIYDTLQVPAGGKPYHLQLADGSKLVVNVASSLRFPENFRKNNSEVELITGEAYFTIIHNAKAPLVIKAKDQFIEDVGTEFNVNTYNDEPDNRTTLIEGAIKVNTRKLKPGEQAILIGNNLTIAPADLEKVTGWVKGDFVFNGEHVQEVMRQLARWYNIDVQYQGNIPGVGFYLKISRSKNVSEVLEALERSTNKVHFKLEGRRVMVSAKKK